MVKCTCFVYFVPPNLFEKKQVDVPFFGEHRFCFSLNNHPFLLAPSVQSDEERLFLDHLGEYRKGLPSQFTVNHFGVAETVFCNSKFHKLQGVV